MKMLSETRKARKYMSLSDEIMEGFIYNMEEQQAYVNKVCKLESRTPVVHKEENFKPNVGLSKPGICAKACK